MYILKALIDGQVRPRFYGSSVKLAGVSLQNRSFKYRRAWLAVRRHAIFFTRLAMQNHASESEQDMFATDLLASRSAPTSREAGSSVFKTAVLLARRSEPLVISQWSLVLYTYPSVFHC